MDESGRLGIEMNLLTRCPHVEAEVAFAAATGNRAAQNYVANAPARPLISPSKAPTQPSGQ